MGTPSEPKKFKKIRNIFGNSEEKALQKVLEETGLSSKQLKAQHTKTTFVWKQIR